MSGKPKTPAPLRELAYLIALYHQYISCDFRVIFVWFSCDFVWFLTVKQSHGTAKMQLKLLSAGNRKACISAFPSKYRLFNSGGQRGIRTLDTLLTYTRVPVVRLRPAQPSVQSTNNIKAAENCLQGIPAGASNGTWTHTSYDTRPSNVPVCLFQHTRKSQ